MNYTSEQRREQGVGPYRSRQGVIFGVCRGLAEHLGLNVFWVRVLTVAAFIFTSFWPVGILYVVLGLLMKPEPVLPLADESDAEFYQSYASSRTLALQRLKRTYDSLDRRIQRIESIVTAPGFYWDRRFEEE